MPHCWCKVVVLIVAVRPSTRAAHRVYLSSLVSSRPDSFFLHHVCFVPLLSIPSRVGVCSAGESALTINGGSLTDGPSGGNDSASDESHPEAKRSRTEIGPPSPSASQLGSGDASAPAPAVCAPQPGAPHVQGPCDAPSAAPDGPSGTSTDFAAAAASAIAAAAASSSDAAPAASQPRDKASSDSTTVPSCGTAPTTEPIDDEDDDEDEDGEYDPTASQYVPGVQTQSLSDVGLGPSPQTRPSADEGSDGSLKLGQVAPTSTEVLTTKQSNDQSFAEDVGPPAVRGGAASLAAENDASAASRTPPGPATTADSASVVAVPLPVATAGAAASDAVAPGAVGTERSAATQPESSSPAATSSPSEPQPPNGATPSALDAEEPPSSPLEVASTSAEANSPPRASTPPPSSVAETEMDAFTDDAQAVHPPSPPIGSSSGQESLPESVMMESEDVRRLHPSACVSACLSCRLWLSAHHCVIVCLTPSFMSLCLDHVTCVYFLWLFVFISLDSHRMRKRMGHREGLCFHFLTNLRYRRRSSRGRPPRLCFPRRVRLVLRKDHGSASNGRVRSHLLR